MRIAYDLQACQTDSRDRGIGRYAMNLVAAMTALSAQRDNYESIVCMDATDAERLRDLRNALRQRNVESKSSVYHYPSAPVTDIDPLRADSAARIRGRAYESLAPDVLLQLSHFEWGTHYCSGLQWVSGSKVRSAVVAYDVIPLIYPERYLPDQSPFTTWYRKKCESFRRFDHFLAISEATRRDLIAYLEISPDRITVIGAGLDASLLAASSHDDTSHAECLRRLDIDAPFVLVVSNGDWRKNTLGAIEAFSALPESLRRSHLLVLTQVGEDVISALNGSFRRVANRVRILGKVDDATLGALYRTCAVFFFPSLYEGFGLPLLEAMAFGAPVLSSNLGSLPEVAHDNCGLFDPRNREVATGLLRRALEDASFRENLSRGAAAFARTFTWENCARKALDALSKFANDTPQRKALLSSDELIVQQDDIAVWTDLLIEGGASDDMALHFGLRAAATRACRRVLIDVSEVAKVDARSGIQRVVRNFCIGLQAIAKTAGFEVQPVRWEDGGMRYANLYARTALGFPSFEPDSMAEARPNDLLFMLDSSWLIPERFDPFHKQVWRAGGEVVWMVYDLIPLLFPQTCDPGMPPAFERWLSHAVATADGFICISESSRYDLEGYIDKHQGLRRRPWTRSVWLGCDLDSGRLGSVSEQAMALDRSLRGAPYFIAVGTIEPRKDHTTILAAFERLWAKGCDCALLIAGKKGWNVDAFVERLRNHDQIGKRLFWFEGLTDTDMSYLMGGAHALIQASLAEGFGLPIIEAAAQGTASILSDIPVFREIAGDEATYFPPRDPDALADAIETCSGVAKRGPVAAVKTLSWEQASRYLAQAMLGRQAVDLRSVERGNQEKMGQTA